MRLDDSAVAEAISAALIDLRDRIEEAKNMEEAKKLAGERKVIKTYWCGKEECAKSIEDEISLDILGITEEVKGKTCIYCKGEAKFTVHLAKTY